MAFLVTLCLGGCGTVRYPLASNAPAPVATSPAGPAFLTGNWQITTEPTKSSSPFASLAGFVYENMVATAAGNPTTAVFQLSPGACYMGAIGVPLAGTVENSSLSLDSFPINGQELHIVATANASATQFTGTYQVSGGCADGATGTLVGLRFEPLAGTYTGVFSQGQAAPSAALTLLQASLGDGRGFSDLGGTASFTNIACFESAAVTPTDSYVVGKTVSLTFAATDGETVRMTGTLDQGASTLTFTDVNITGGACSGDLGAATFAQS